MKVGRLVVKVMSCSALMIGCVGCGESPGGLNPVSPSSVSTNSSTQASLTGWSTLDESRVPAIRVPEGISCPSDAPIVIVSGLGVRVDIEWSPIPTVSGYEVAIERFSYANVWEPVARAKVTSPRYEWQGQSDSRYRARVRSLRCGGEGIWSPWLVYTIDGPGQPPVISEIPDKLPPPGPPEGIVPPGPSDDDQPDEPSCEPTNPTSSERTSSWRKLVLAPCDFSWGDERVKH